MYETLTRILIAPLPLWYWVVAFAGIGACVGSFLNVLIYRLPAGKGVIWPPSACGHCGHRLAFWENIPILSWLMLRGRCRKCQQRISMQYVLVEVATAVLFGGLVLVLCGWNLRAGFYQQGYPQNFYAVWPMLLVYASLMACLLAATVVDFRYFMIPLQLPWFATVVAVVVPPLAIALGWLVPDAQLVPMVDVPGALGLIGGGLAGLLIAVILLELGVLRESFIWPPPGAEEGAEAQAALTSAPAESEQAEPSSPQPISAFAPRATPAGAGEVAPGSPLDGFGTPDDWLGHPHPRWETLKELLFLAFPLLGMVLGVWLLGPWLAGLPSLPPAGQAVAGACLGYLVGGGVIWAIRVLGTLGFGKEAMGMGDVHLLAAIGACLGAVDAVIVFFVAPFFGIAGAIVTFMVTRLRGGGEIPAVPYGPYLAMAAVAVILLSDAIRAYFHL